MTNNTVHTLTVNASTANLAEVREFVSKHSREFGFDDKQISDIRLAVDEACTNIIKHAYQFDEKQNVEIKIGQKKDYLWVSLTDSGKTFNPESYSKPDLREQMKNRKRGGVGVFLIRKLMDEVQYMKEGDTNVIRMYKYRS